MAGSLSWIGGDSWPSDEGWPYDDGDRDPADPAADVDDDSIALHALTPQLLDELDPLERQVVTARFGLDGGRARSMKELCHDLGLPRSDVRMALGGGLAKLRSHLG
ncbi:MAG: sigma factor-like helix-turn-helix DNA-binding protein [Acidimicrobiales bacterium]